MTNVRKAPKPRTQINQTLKGETAHKLFLEMVIVGGSGLTTMCHLSERNAFGETVNVVNLFDIESRCSRV